MTSEIKPCPFCDGTPTLAAKSPVEGPTPWRVSCPKCWAAGPASTTEAEAISSWNRRAAVAELVEALEEVKRTLEEPQPAIACTIWAATSPAETLYDHVCTALSRHQAGMKDKDHG